MTGLGCLKVILFEHVSWDFAEKENQLYSIINNGVFCLPGVPVRVDWDECMHLFPVHVDVNGLEIF